MVVGVAINEFKKQINQFSYPIKIGTNILNTLPEEIAKFTNSRKVLIIIDRNLIQKYGISLKRHLQKRDFSCNFLKITAGKKCKDASQIC